MLTILAGKPDTKLNARARRDPTLTLTGAQHATARCFSSTMMQLP
jgi:hypothetical protein